MRCMLRCAYTQAAEVEEQEGGQAHAFRRCRVRLAV